MTSHLTNQRSPFGQQEMTTGSPRFATIRKNGDFSSGVVHCLFEAGCFDKMEESGVDLEFDSLLTDDDLSSLGTSFHELQSKPITERRYVTHCSPLH